MHSAWLTACADYTSSRRIMSATSSCNPTHGYLPPASHSINSSPGSCFCIVESLYREMTTLRKNNFVVNSGRKWWSTVRQFGPKWYQDVVNKGSSVALSRTSTFRRTRRQRGAYELPWVDLVCRPGGLGKAPSSSLPWSSCLSSYRCSHSTGLKRAIVSRCCCSAPFSGLLR